jgi:serine/threonine protein kinase
MNSHFTSETIQPFDETEVAYIMQQIFSILAYMHYEGYVHRDIKPENFLCTCDELGPIKLASLATVMKRNRSAGLKGVVGTYLYMAPEMLMGKCYSKEVDMWSAGVIMYLLLTGTHPIVDMEEESIDMYRTLIKRALVVEDAVIFNQGRTEVRLMKKEVKNLLKQLLEADPKKRITAERAMHDPWIVRSVKIMRRKNILNIERKIRKRNDLHDVLMNIISVICAPILKVMLLDRMCNHSIYARNYGYPEVTSDQKEFYEMLFYLLDDNASGFLSKTEILGCISFN